MVYLLHYASPLHHAQHYLGYYDNPARIEQHANGTSRAHLPSAFHALGVPFQVVRTWDGDRHLERKLKTQRDARRLCPVCRADRLAANAAVKRATRARKKEQERRSAICSCT